MRLIPVLISIIAAASCKTANNEAKVKEIESVKKVTVVQGDQPGGGKIAVIRCAFGWIDTSGQTEFTVSWTKVQNLSYIELEQNYCTEPLVGGGGAPVKLGYYNLVTGSGCSTLHLTPKTQAGTLKGITMKCMIDDVVSNLSCGASSICKEGVIELSYFDGDLVEVMTSGTSRNYKLVGENDDCFTKGGKRHSGICWVFAKSPGTDCSFVCGEAQLVFDPAGAALGTNRTFCHKLGAKFGMPQNDYVGGPQSGNHGCVYCTNQGGGTCSGEFIGVFHTGPSTPGDVAGNFRLFCPCK